MADEEEGEILVGGDFNAFEVTLAVADSGDKKLEADVRRGLKIHAIFATKMFPGTTYDQILASSGTEHDMYTLGKNGVFTMIYGGDENTLINKYGVAEENAKAAFAGFDREYPQLGDWRREAQRKFQVISQAALGQKIKIHEADTFVDSMFGYKRYFTLELQIIKELVNMAENIPEEWKSIKVKVLRRADRGLQLVGNAVRSALYGAAFGLQGAVQRAASNHRIQAAGARITKVIQVAIWTRFQPAGFAQWAVRPMNIHDEILVVTRPELADAVEEEVKTRVEEFRPKVPLIGIDWGPMESWSKGLKESKVRKVKQLLVEGKNDEDIVSALELKSDMVSKIAQIRKGRTWRWLAADNTPASTAPPKI
jgi:DNA polymerase I-like protein with 3'-5' exonuclease and polymerase domains